MRLVDVRLQRFEVGWLKLGKGLGMTRSLEGEQTWDRNERRQVVAVLRNRTDKKKAFLEVRDSRNADYTVQFEGSDWKTP